MNIRQLAVLACKLLGLISLLLTLQYSVSIFWIAMSNDQSFFMANLAPALLVVGVGLTLLFGANRIGGWLAGDLMKADSTALSVPRGFDVVAIALLGMFSLLSSLPGLLNRVLYAMEQSELELANSLGSVSPGIIGSALRVALGLWLVLGARGWSNVLRNLRNVGLQPDERPWPDGPAIANPESENQSES